MADLSQAGRALLPKTACRIAQKKKVLQVTIAILIRFCRWGCGLAWVNWREVFGNKLER